MQKVIQVLVTSTFLWVLPFRKEGFTGKYCFEQLHQKFVVLYPPGSSRENWPHLSYPSHTLDVQRYQGQHASIFEPGPGILHFKIERKIIGIQVQVFARYLSHI